MQDHVKRNEIILSEGIDVSPDKQAFKKVTLEFSQEIKSKKQRKKAFLFDDKYLGIKSFKPAHKTYWVNLLFVDAQPQHKKQIPWTFSFIAFGLLVIATLLAVVIKYTDLLPLYPIGIPAIILSITLAILFIILTIYRSTSILTFNTTYGKIPVVEFYHNNPNKKDFEKFVARLTQCIKTIKAARKYKKSQFLPAEMAEHRRLHKEGVIQDKDYEIAKANILKIY